MPTPASAAAFAQLVQKRACLNQISRRLREALPNRYSVEGERHFRELQAEWDKALLEMQEATDKFSTVINDVQPAG